MLFDGKNVVRYGYSRYGNTRGNGTVWHGGIDIEGTESKTIKMPSFNGKAISGTVVKARIVTDKRNKTWEWGYYVCVQLDAKQTTDAVNFLYFCHNSKNLVTAGQKVKTGDALAIMGNTGNAALASPPFEHCHFEVRKTSTSKGLDPTAYCGFPNEVGTYGDSINSTTHAKPAPAEPAADAPASADYCLYTVQAGDSFYKIAETMLGRGTRYPEICTLNGLDAKAVLTPGQKLKVPTAGSYAATVSVYALNVRADASTSAKIVGVVKKGEAVTVYAEHNKMGYIGGGWCALQYLTKA